MIACTHRIFLTTLCAVATFLLSPYAPAQAHLTVVQMCDTQLGMGGYDHDVETFKLAVEQINALAPDLVLICGDLVDDGTSDKSFGDFNAIKEKFTVPCYPASGNHDVGNKPTPATLARYREHIGRDYYTVEKKNYTFVIVNTQLWKAPVPEETEKQDAWFVSVLAKAKAEGRPVVVVGHYPPFVNKPDEKEEYMNLPREARAAFLERCTENGVVAIMAGHLHSNVVREYEGIPIVASASSSRNFDNAPMGFRIWRFDREKAVSHEYRAIKGASPPADDPED